MPRQHKPQVCYVAGCSRPTRGCHEAEVKTNYVMYVPLVVRPADPARPVSSRLSYASHDGLIRLLEIICGEMTTDKMDTDQPQKEPAEAKPEAPKFTPLDALKNICNVLDNAVKQKETRLMSGRVMRLTAALRKHLTPELLLAYVTSCLPSSARSVLVSSIHAVRGG